MARPEVPALAMGLRVSPLRLRRRTSAQARAANRVLQRTQALDLPPDHLGGARGGWGGRGGCGRGRVGQG